MTVYIRGNSREMVNGITVSRFNLKVTGTIPHSVSSSPYCGSLQMAVNPVQKKTMYFEIPILGMRHKVEE